VWERTASTAKAQVTQLRKQQPKKSKKGRRNRRQTPTTVLEKPRSWLSRSQVPPAAAEENNDFLSSLESRNLKHKLRFW